MVSTSDLAEYEAQRKELVSSDRASRADHVKKISPLEQLADEILRDVRAMEAASVWSADYPLIPHPFPGMGFLTGRSIIVQTKLFQILRKMPKGALLHAHLDATVDISLLLELALQYPAFHVRVPEPLNATNLGTVLPEFRPLPPELFTIEAVGLTDIAYTPGTWVPMIKAREMFSPSLGGPEGFDHWVTDALMINPSEAYGTYNTVTKIWKKFENTFRISFPFVRFLPLLRDYFREYLLSSIEDGISYSEPRLGFPMQRSWYDANGQLVGNNREVLLIFDAVLKEIKAEMRQQGREDDFIGARIIYCAIRFIAPSELGWYLQDCIALKKEFPHLIAGFDLIGDENNLRPLADYIEPLLHFREMQRAADTEIPFLFHAGETLGDGTKADMNLYDAILLGTKRIGHGFSLVKHPKLIEVCKEREIMIEVCPISNEILRLTSSMPMHPLPVLLNHGVHVALCSDDPAIFGNMGLTFDYFQVFASSEITGIIQLGELAKDSIKFSTLEGEEKQRALSSLQKNWDRFLQYVVDAGQEHLNSVGEGVLKSV